MPESTVELKIKLDDSVWTELVELSQSQGDATPAKTVEDLVYRTLKVFLHGKSVGIKNTGLAVSQEMNRMKNSKLSIESDCPETR